jgi:hypothetical protein
MKRRAMSYGEAAVSQRRPQQNDCDGASLGQDAREAAGLPYMPFG